MTLFFILQSYFSTYIAQDEPCGIPIVNWNYMFWTLSTSIGMCSPVFNILIGLSTKSLKYMTISMYLTMAIMVYTMAGWTIYGYTLAGSPENDCAL